jgi:hypothetical protein
METIIEYFNNRFQNDNLTDQDRIVLVNILYGDLNLIETLEENLNEECIADQDIIDLKKYIKSQERLNNEEKH